MVDSNQHEISVNLIALKTEITDYTDQLDGEKNIEIYVASLLLDKKVERVNNPIRTSSDERLESMDKEKFLKGHKAAIER